MNAFSKIAETILAVCGIVIVACFAVLMVAMTADIIGKLFVK